MGTLPLTLECARAALATSCIGRSLYYWPSVRSTMDKAHWLASRAKPGAELDGTLVIADEQTAGRGRLDRSWWAPAGTSLLLSLLLCPPLAPHQAQRLTMICSLAVCDAIAEQAGLEAHIKWPNDVLIGKRKVCGILTELDFLGDHLNYAIVGIGINVNVDFRDAPPLASPATSLLAEAGREISRLDLLLSLLSGIEIRYLGLREGRSYHQEWTRRLATLGEHVQISGAGGQWHGLATAVDEDGALLLQTDDGRIRRVLAGDVTLRSEDHGL